MSIRKRIISILVLVLIVGGATAQSNPIEVTSTGDVGSDYPTQIRFGPRIGVNMSTTQGAGSSDRTYIPGILMGGTLEVRFNKWFALWFDVLFSNNGYKAKDSSDREVVSYVNFPLMANFYVIDKLAVKIGIQPSLMVAARYLPKEGSRIDTKDNWKQMDFIIPIGVSYIFVDRIEVDLRYNYGFRNTSKLKVGKHRNSSFSLSVAYKF